MNVLACVRSNGNSNTYTRSKGELNSKRARNHYCHQSCCQSSSLKRDTWSSYHHVFTVPSSPQLWSNTHTHTHTQREREREREKPMWRMSVSCGQKRNEKKAKGKNLSLTHLASRDCCGFQVAVYTTPVWPPSFCRMLPVSMSQIYMYSSYTVPTKITYTQTCMVRGLDVWVRVCVWEIRAMLMFERGRKKKQLLQHLLQILLLWEIH